MQDKREASLTLEILEAIETRSDVTQRRLAKQMGIALGLANSYLRRCVRKGLVKIQQAPRNRYAYYLTRKGFAEKSRLTLEYLTSSFDYYNHAGASMVESYCEIAHAGRHRVLFAGMSELAEIASVRAHDFDVDIVGTWDAGSKVNRFIGRPVWTALEDADDFDVALVTDLVDPHQTYECLVTACDSEQIKVPQLLAHAMLHQNKN